ncbi:MAG TPA: hypothetical protein PLD54_01310 [Candidatus Levybacteria bacterium]|nr:hypothetical protein [Candidatus Levybacteria bacterium]
MKERRFSPLHDHENTLLRGISLDGTRPRIQNFSSHGSNIETILPTNRFVDGVKDTFVALEMIKNNSESYGENQNSQYRLRYQPAVSDKSRERVQDFLSCVDREVYEEKLSEIIRMAYPECVYTEAEGFKFGADEHSTYISIDKNGVPGIHPAIVIPEINIRGGWNDVSSIGFRYKMGYSEKYTSFEYLSGISYREDDYSLSLVTYTGVIVNNLLLSRLNRDTKAQIDGLYWDDRYADAAIQPYIRAEIE